MRKLLGKPWFWLTLLILGGMLFYNKVYQPVFQSNVRTEEGKPQAFYIHTGWDYEIVGEELKKQKLVKDLQAFHWVAQQMNYPNHVYPGRYILEDGMSSRDLVTLLRSGKQTPLTFTFVKFRTKQDLAAYAGTKLEMDGDELLVLLEDEAFLQKHRGLKPESAIMVFIPNTYELYWNITPKAFFERMFKEYDRFWTEARDAQRRKLNLTRTEVMTLASIVEEETIRDDEKPQIAGVYLNRIRKNWPLQADPTVKFAIGDPTLKRILNKHLTYPSPYNTYLNTGIPPGPICTPSIKSIDAVLQGQRHSYMYFCAKINGNGYHKFSETLAEHNAYADRYHRHLDQLGIR